MYLHAILTLPGGRQKSIWNKTEEELFSTVVLPYVSNGVVTYKWGKSNQTYQVIDLRVYQTADPWNRKEATFDDFLRGKKNAAKKFIEKANKLLVAPKSRVFVVMPIQGDKFGTQNDQRIHKEFDDRFEALEEALSKFDCVAIRIDKEVPLEDLVKRIKSEIAKSKFIIADLTDERPSCYFEAGYGEALKKPVIYIASKESVVSPGSKTKIHFDIHMNVNFFSNHTELQTKISAAIEKNQEILFPKPETESVTTAIA